MFGDALGSMTTTKKTEAGHPEHKHKLELKIYNKRFTCNGCKEQGFGPRYRCERCDYDLHKECMFPKTTICHDFFEESTFEFFAQPRTKCGNSHCKKHARCCDACGKDICGFVYHCVAKGWDLHPCCSNLKNSLSIDGVNFELRDKVSSKCMWCNKKVLWPSSSKQIPGWSYVSDCERYHFHVHCVTELVHEAWKKGAIDDINSMALEKMDLRLAVNSNTSGGRGSEFWRTVKIFLKTIVGILLGDPTMIIASVLVELISN